MHRYWCMSRWCRKMEVIHQVCMVSCHRVVGACSGQVKGQGSTFECIGNFEFCYRWASEFGLLVLDHKLRLIDGDLFARLLLHEFISPSGKFLRTKVSQTILFQDRENQVIGGMATLFFSFESQACESVSLLHNSCVPFRGCKRSVG